MEQATEDRIVQSGDLIVRLDEEYTVAVTVGGRWIRPTAKEYAVLEFLCKHKGSPRTRYEILEHLYADEMRPPEVKIIDVFVCNLRRKLDPNNRDRFIRTVWNKGYVLRTQSTRRSSH